MPADSSFGRFFYPGPTEVRPDILRAMVQPMIPHRGVEAQALNRRLMNGLRHVFRTRRPVYVMTASATGMMEAAVRNAQEGPALALVNGAFSARFARIAQLCDRRTRVLEVPWGETHPLDLVDEVLGTEQFGLMTVVHSETSTGVLSDIRALTALARVRSRSAVSADSARCSASSARSGPVTVVRPSTRSDAIRPESTQRRTVSSLTARISAASAIR